MRTRKFASEIYWPLGCKPDVAALCVVDCIKQPFLWNWSSLTPLRSIPFPQWIEIISEWVWVFSTLIKNCHFVTICPYYVTKNMLKARIWKQECSSRIYFKPIVALPWLEDLVSIEPFWRFDAYCIEAVRPKMTKHYVDVLPQMGLSIHELN